MWTRSMWWSLGFVSLFTMWKEWKKESVFLASVGVIIDKERLLDNNDELRCWVAKVTARDPLLCLTALS